MYIKSYLYPFLKVAEIHCTLVFGLNCHRWVGVAHFNLSTKNKVEDVEGGVGAGLCWGKAGS